jgi:hypothetical protein
MRGSVLGSVPEDVLYISSLGVFDNRTLLNVLTRATPKVIFPARKIGELRDGYVASSLALDGNPIDGLENIKRISVRVKEGIVLEVRPSHAGASTTAK